MIKKMLKFISALLLIPLILPMYASAASIAEPKHILNYSDSLKKTVGDCSISYAVSYLTPDGTWSGVDATNLDQKSLDPSIFEYVDSMFFVDNAIGNEQIVSKSDFPGITKGLGAMIDRISAKNTKSAKDRFPDFLNIYDLCDKANEGTKLFNFDNSKAVFSSVNSKIKFNLILSGNIMDTTPFNPRDEKGYTYFASIYNRIASGNPKKPASGKKQIEYVLNKSFLDDYKDSKSVLAGFSNDSLVEDIKDNLGIDDFSFNGGNTDRAVNYISGCYGDAYIEMLAMCPGIGTWSSEVIELYHDIVCKDSDDYPDYLKNKKQFIDKFKTYLKEVHYYAGGTYECKDVKEEDISEESYSVLSMTGNDMNKVIKNIEKIWADKYFDKYYSTLDANTDSNDSINLRGFLRTNSPSGQDHAKPWEKLNDQGAVLALISLDKAYENKNLGDLVDIAKQIATDKPWKEPESDPKSDYTIKGRKYTYDADIKQSKAKDITGTTFYQEDMINFFMHHKMTVYSPKGSGVRSYDVKANELYGIFADSTDSTSLYFKEYLFSLMQVTALPVPENKSQEGQFLGEARAKEHYDSMKANNGDLDDSSFVDAIPSAGASTFGKGDTLDLGVDVPATGLDSAKAKHPWNINFYAGIAECPADSKIGDLTPKTFDDIERVVTSYVRAQHLDVVDDYDKNKDGILSKPEMDELVSKEFIETGVYSVDGVSSVLDQWGMNLKVHSASEIAGIILICLTSIFLALYAIELGTEGRLPVLYLISFKKLTSFEISKVKMICIMPLLIGVIVSLLNGSLVNGIYNLVIKFLNFLYSINLL